MISWTIYLVGDLLLWDGEEKCQKLEKWSFPLKKRKNTLLLKSFHPFIKK